MATPYEEIYRWAARKLDAPELIELSDDDLSEEFEGWLFSAIAQFRRCKNDLSDRNEECKEFRADLLDIEKEILGVLMARAWLAPKLNSSLLTNQMFGEKEQKFYSQKEHLSGLEARYKNLEIEAQSLHRDYTYANCSYLEV